MAAGGAAAVSGVCGRARRSVWNVESLASGAAWPKFGGDVGVVGSIENCPSTHLGLSSHFAGWRLVGLRLCRACVAGPGAGRGTWRLWPAVLLGPSSVVMLVWLAQLRIALTGNS